MEAEARRGLAEAQKGRRLLSMAPEVRTEGANTKPP